MVGSWEALVRGSKLGGLCLSLTFPSFLMGPCLEVEEPSYNHEEERPSPGPLPLDFIVHEKNKGLCVWAPVVLIV